VCPVIADSRLASLDRFHYEEYRDENAGTPDFVKYHAEALKRAGVKIGVRGGYEVLDLHKHILLEFTFSGKKYKGGVDAAIVPYAIRGFSAGHTMRGAFEHKQSDKAKDEYLTAHPEEKKVSHASTSFVFGTPFPSAFLAFSYRGFPSGGSESSSAITIPESPRSSYLCSACCPRSLQSTTGHGSH
jgi:hypothetical protein